ncbi:bifunctional 2-methylcitrate dehydratase/aconitate hydratase [Thermus thermophilus]|uniref:bifunctional 2-methylcitrate dehydratase/aconitate hydratase n=1 Tax=Thermus thermophilus TaxID=274 RepID=UPI001FCA511E|nr:bifunctional 2-methylcitrate dehydratase/aconitate hydratase [Thermus thermophilus]BDG22799.1 2-methylcitrate dehydratase [Thermus thermophilus]BDG29872.1 2-methylcitrate dehydratase [Thermus thermophilus]
MTAYDPVLETLADYTLSKEAFSPKAYETARYALADALACAFLALRVPEARKLLGPVVPGAEPKEGARVPGTPYILDPVTAAFNLGLLVRWLDYNDTWLAAEWGHPSDNLGAILMAADWLSQKRRTQGEEALRVQDLLTAMIKAYEVQGVLALENSLNRVGFDHVLFVKVASTAATSFLLGLDREAVLAALSNAFMDVGPLRAYRHYPNTGSRKSWAAGDASARGLWLALLAARGEMGYPKVLSVPRWGFEEVVTRKPITLARPLSSYVMENVLFKIRFPAEFHGQTAVEAALALHPQVKDRLNEIARIRIETQEPAVRIISKKGPLKNPADRDHCIEYMVAVALIYGELTEAHYEEPLALDPRIEDLRAVTEVVEVPAYTEAYYDPERRAIPNAVQIFFKDGTATPRVEVLYPIGHPRRREEGIPLLKEKVKGALQAYFPKERAERLYLLLFEDPTLPDWPVDRFVEAFWGF